MFRQFLLIGFCVLFVSVCTGWKQKVDETVSEIRDFEQIRQEGVLKAVTLYSSVSYFEYRMEPMGYEYDLVKDFADSQGLKLEIKVAESDAELVEILQAGEADVIAFPLRISNELKEEVLFCGREEQSSQVLVQRAERQDALIKDVTGLIGKGVYVKANTRYHERLENLNGELGGGILIHTEEADSITPEDLIEQVANGQIPYTICDENVARINRTYFRNINIDLKVSFPQRSSWSVRPSSPQLAAAINEWALGTTGKKSYEALMKRYFELSKLPYDLKVPDIRNGIISPYDHLFRKYAQRLGWEWQLLASIAYQESHFNPKVRSWAGARGIMGIMPATARAFGVTPEKLDDPETGIRTGTDCLIRFRKGLSQVEDPVEKMKFTLASYNAGIGHIYDAQRLAEKYGRNPYIWDNNVAEYVRLKSDPAYYNDPVCKHGYLCGSETYNYVKEVLERYEYYKKATGRS
ncbi:MAG: transporter substrate-binding domain-containing protein [Tannerellaceae bacterium]|nr:transporter substrate-binding domain-containing protein [Tannerellaceae bacterium]